MNPEHNMRYEGFIRNVFGKVGRWEDPLKLANTDINQNAFLTKDLTELKLGTVYGLKRLQIILEEDHGETGKTCEEIDDYINEIFNNNVDYNRIHQILEIAIKLIKKYNI